MRALKKAVQAAAGAFGYEVHRKGLAASGPTLTAALERLARRGEGLFRTVIDVGASDGRWSADALARFPNADYLLMEAQPVHEPALQAFCARHANVRHVLAAAGARVGEIYFDAGDPFGGLASETPLPANCIRVPVTTIDEQVAQRRLEGPFLIKLDVHGFELPILQGAAQTLERTSVLIIECYNFPMSAPGSLMFPEMCRHLSGLGFRPADLFDLCWRDCDGVLWQMDIAFLRADRPEYRLLQYR